MSVSNYSTSAQNYLKTIWAMQEWDQDRALQPSALANYVGVRPSTVTDAIKKLADLGLVDHSPYSDITLTATGRKHALEMVRRHRLIETYLVQELGYSWDEVHDEAEVLEHAVSDKIIERIDAKLGFPTKDPHGDPIPNAAGEIVIPDASPMTGADVSRDVVVERISDDDPKLLQYLAQHGVEVGSRLRFEQDSPFSETLTAATATGTITLGAAALSQIWISRP
ncbi:MAG: metal-dependent transcriptional regulator [Microbacteriaceae bacterium]|nr:metal-dependent transcriptional regulator [Microbacteriaceae bacterium]